MRLAHVILTSPLLVLFPSATAAPVPAEADRPAFGANGLLTRADLEKLRFTALRDPDPREDRRVAGLAVAVHMPRTRFRHGEPVPAYFGLKNPDREARGLDMQLALHGPRPTTWNGCDVLVRDLATRQPVDLGWCGGWRCGSGSLVDVPAGGYYVARGDLGRAAKGPLPPGEYEVSWRHGRLRSDAVRFAVEAVEHPVAPRPNRPDVRFLGVGPHGEPRLGRGALARDETILTGYDADSFAAGLGVGVGGVYVPDLHEVPSADGVVRVSAEWTAGPEGERVKVTLQSADPDRSVRFARTPHLYLHVEGRFDDRSSPVEHAKQPKLSEALDERLVTPLTVEFRLPQDWRKATGHPDGCRVAVLVTSEEVAVWHGRSRLEQLKEVVAVRDDKRPVWSGVVRTAFTDLDAAK